MRCMHRKHTRVFRSFATLCDSNSLCDHPAILVRNAG